MNLPADTDKRYIEGATGNLEGMNYDEIRHEGYGIGGAALIVDCMTDSRVRAWPEVRHTFGKYGGNLGTEGSVTFQFKHCGQLVFAPGTSEDEMMEVALDAGAEDVVVRRGEADLGQHPELAGQSRPPEAASRLLSSHRFRPRRLPRVVGIRSDPCLLQVPTDHIPRVQGERANLHSPDRGLED